MPTHRPLSWFLVGLLLGLLLGVLFAPLSMTVDVTCPAGAPDTKVIPEPTLPEKLPKLKNENWSPLGH